MIRLSAPKNRGSHGAIRVAAAETELAARAAAILGENKAKLTREERALIDPRLRVGRRVVTDLREAVRAGYDPLGDAFASARIPEARRPLGATYTPQAIVEAMVAWAATHARPDRVVDPGVGSGRFLMEASRRFPGAKLVGVDIDPLATLIARANLSALGAARRATIMLSDYRELRLPHIGGKTLFIGNPPYVRHHLISADWKNWFVRTARGLGLKASSLAGLHVHFVLATHAIAREGDYGALITAAEWLDVNYGRVLRELFLNGLGGDGITIIDPRAHPFPDALSTAAITTFGIGTKPPSIRLSRLQSLVDLPKALWSGPTTHRQRFETSTQWSHLLRAAPSVRDGYVELGELVRVHRGQVTGANAVWIAGPASRHLPASVHFASVTRARELIEAGPVLRSGANLKRVIDLPADLDGLASDEREAVENFLAWAKSQGAHNTYIARHRRPWWSVGLKPPPAIIATYMARRPPVFVENAAGARLINIAHGLYPREQFPKRMIRSLVEALRKAAVTARGRVYAGGLLKLEPREMERIMVPGPELLTAGIAD